METVITFQSHPFLWCLAVSPIVAVLAIWCAAAMVAVAKAPLREDDGVTPEKPWLPENFEHAEDRRPTPDRPKRAVTAWEKASSKEYWEAFQATEDAKRRQA